MVEEGAANAEECIKLSRNGQEMVRDVLKWEARGESNEGTTTALSFDPTLAFISPINGFICESVWQKDDIGRGLFSICWD